MAITVYQTKRHVVRDTPLSKGSSPASGYSGSGTTQSYSFVDSIQNILGRVNLIGDATTPGNNKSYGTDGSGARGWQNTPDLTNYYTKTQLDAGQLDTRYYTETELNAGQLDTRYYTETESDNRFVHLTGNESIDDVKTFSHQVVLSAGAKSDEFISDHAFVSGFAGSGYKLNHVGTEFNLEVDNLVVRKAMQVYELQINKLSSINGGIVISVANGISCSIAPDYLGGNVWKIYFDEDGTNKQIQFVANDYVRAQVWTGRRISSFVGRVFTVVHSTTLGSAYITVSTANTPWINMELVQVGHSTTAARQNLIYMTASDTNNPYIDVISGVTDGDFTGHTMVRLGNLTGIGTLSGYGLYVSSGDIAGFTVNATSLEFHGATSHVVISNTENVTAGYGRGLNIYDSGAVVGKIRLVNVGQIRTLNSSNYPATPEYGFEVLKREAVGVSHLIRMGGSTNMIAGWNIDYDAIYTGTKVTVDDFATNTGDFTIHSDGSLHAKRFYIGADGEAVANNITLNKGNLHPEFFFAQTTRIDQNGIYESDENGFSALCLNYVGYNGGTTQYRTVDIFDGKQQMAVRLGGINKAIYGAGAVAITPRTVSTANATQADSASTIIWAYTTGNSTLYLMNTPADGQIITIINITTNRTVTIDGQNHDIVVAGTDVATTTIGPRRSTQFIFSETANIWFRVQVDGV